MKFGLEITTCVLVLCLGVFSLGYMAKKDVLVKKGIVRLFNN